MAPLSIAADRVEIRVTAGIPAAINFEVSGWPGPGLAVSVASEPAGLADQWISAVVSPAGGTTWRGVVTFDPSRGSRARPGTYPVEVSVHGDDQRASTVVRFVVERHPCLQIRPQPSFTWDPFANTAKLRVALWNCGNVDLGVDWTARLKGRHLEVNPATVSVLADSGVTETTLSIKIPDAKVDLETEIDMEARSEVRVDRFSASQGSGLDERSRPRRRSGRLTAAVATLVIAIAAIVAVVTLTDGDDPPNTTLPPTATTSPTTDVPPAARVEATPAAGVEATPAAAVETTAAAAVETTEFSEP